MGLFIFLISVLTFSTNLSAHQIMLETGTVWQQRNDVKIPPQSGTLTEFDQFDKGPFFHYRLEAEYVLSDKQALRLVYAPLNIRVTGQTSNPVVFDGVTFSANTDLTVDYTFNSYRLTWVYGFWKFGKDRLSLGVTGKIRDAEITFEQGTTKVSYDNIGFVPLVYFDFQKQILTNWQFSFNTDFAAASQGRAIDMAIKFRRQIGDSFFLGIGGRTLEGGADNDKVFTFSWLNYAVVDLVGSF